MYNPCTSYELSQSPECPTKSQKICQLKSQLIQLEEDDKAYNDLLNRYRQLQNDFQIMNDAKLHLEYELKQKTENTNKILNDLKCQNVDLTNELAEKNSIYEKLFADKTNLLSNLDERNKEHDNFTQTAMNNDRIISDLNQMKIKCENDALLLDNTTKKNADDINNLCNRLNSLKLKNGTQKDEINRQNIEINNNTKSLNDIKSTNVNINNEINVKRSNLDSIQSQLNLANKAIVDLQNDIQNLDQTLNIGKDDLNKLKFDLQNQHIKRVQIEDDNNKLEAILKDRDDTIKRLTCLQETLKSDNDKLINGKNKLLMDIDMYKNHIMVLTEQTEKLNIELERIINEDKDVYNLNLAQIQRLQKIICDNKKLLQQEIEALNALENYVKSKPSLCNVHVNVNNVNNNEQNPQVKEGQKRQTYYRKN
jgi:chromosome segregation ATPase